MSDTELQNGDEARPAVRSGTWLAVTEWEHPDWDMKIILPDDESRGKPEDYLTDGQDAARLKPLSHYELSTDQLDKLPEWDG